MKTQTKTPTGLVVPSDPDKDGIFTTPDKMLKFKPAPNRYRRLYKDGQTQEEHDIAQKEGIRLQGEEFPIKGFDPVGMEISPYNWDEVLVWLKKTS